MKLARALLCANCDSVSQASGMTKCGVCGSPNVQSLSRLLAGRMQQLPARELNEDKEMTPARLFKRWCEVLPSKFWHEFADDIVGVVAYERNRLRRALTTDDTALAEATAKTQSELESAALAEHHLSVAQARAEGGER